MADMPERERAARIEVDGRLAGAGGGELEPLGNGRRAAREGAAVRDADGRGACIVRIRVADCDIVRDGERAAGDVDRARNAFAVREIEAVCALMAPEVDLAAGEVERELRVIARSPRRCVVCILDRRCRVQAVGDRQRGDVVSRSADMEAPIGLETCGCIGGGECHGRRAVVEPAVPHAVVPDVHCHRLAGGRAVKTDVLARRIRLPIEDRRVSRQISVRGPVGGS